MTEVALSRLLADVLGGAALASAAVGAAYLAGLGLGGALGARLARSRLGAFQLFALIEGSGAAVTLLLPSLLPLLRTAMAGAGPFARLLMAAAATLPVALPGGAALPACAGRFASGNGRDPGERGGLFYGLGAAGAAAGALLAGIVVLPALGLWGGCAVAAAIDLAIAALALGMGRGRAQGPLPHEEAAGAPAPLPRAAARLPALAGLSAAALAGLAGLSAEILWIRLLLPWLGGTSRALATILGLYLAGTGIGAALASRAARRDARARAVLALSLCGAALTLSSAIGLSLLDGWVRVQRASGAGLIAATMLLPATLGFGAATPFLFAAHGEGRSDGDALAGIGWASGLGSAAGALLAPFVLASRLGPRAGLFVAAGLCLAAALPLVRGRELAAVAASALVLGGAAWGTPGAGPLPPGLRLIRRAEGSLAEAWSIEEPVEHARGLEVNGRLREGGTALEARAAEALQAHVPLLWHPSPRRLLWLGVGTGVSLAAAESHPLERAEGVELLSSVLELLPTFAPYNAGIARAVLVEDDARSFLTSSRARYDVVVGELFYPWEVGAGGLYSAEQLRAARDHLAPGGLFCQWLPLYLLPPRGLSVVAATLRSVFPHTAALAGLVVAEQPQIALCGAEEPIRPPKGTAPRVAALRDGGALSRLWGDPDSALASLFLFGDEGMAEIAGDAPIETDLRPRIEFLSAEAAFRLREDWTENLTRLRALAAPEGPWAEARLALIDEALALGLGRLDRAVELQTRAVELAPGLGESALAGLRLEGPLRRARRYAEAEALLDRAVRTLDPDARTLFMAGTLRLRAGDASDAEPLLRQSLALDPADVDCLLHLGLALRAQGRQEEAEAYWRKALELDPGDERALRYLRR